VKFRHDKDGARNLGVVAAIPDKKLVESVDFQSVGTPKATVAACEFTTCNRTNVFGVIAILGE